MSSQRSEVLNLSGERQHKASRISGPASVHQHKYRTSIQTEDMDYRK